MPPLNQLRALEAAIRRGSFTKAADELSVTQGAISRHVRTLEEHLGFDLFERANNNLLVPPESRRFAESLTHAFDSISRATKALTQDRRRTVLVVRCYTNFMVRWLIPRLPLFQTAHPEIEIRLSAGRPDVDFARSDVDVAIKWGTGDWPDLDSELLFHVETVPACSPKFALRHDFQKPEDLLSAPLFHVSARRDEWPQWFRLASSQPFDPQHVVYIEDQTIVHECLLAGMGVGLSQRQYIVDDLDAGLLVTPFDIALQQARGFYVVCPPDRLAIPAVWAFREWIVDCARPN
ncbi:transcriptional regulator GcvA [soil metagenome]